MRDPSVLKRAADSKSDFSLFQVPIPEVNYRRELRNPGDQHLTVDGRLDARRKNFPLFLAKFSEQSFGVTDHSEAIGFLWIAKMDRLFLKVVGPLGALLAGRVLLRSRLSSKPPNSAGGSTREFA
jgi:hypothetical protein